MKLEQSQIDYIKVTFSQMNTRLEFLGLLNYVKPIIFSEDTKLFELKQLAFYSNPNRASKFYKKIELKKKSGGIRNIYAPTKGLKALQKCLNVILQCVFVPHKNATGFVLNKSIIDNAQLHICSNYVYNLDLKDFFPSIDQARVWSCLKLKPFNLYTENLDINNLNTGIRKFITDYNTEIFYRAQNGKFSIIWDRNGNYDKSVKHFGGDENAFLEDCKKYIFSDREINILNHLVDNRQTLANIIAGISCASQEVERLDENGDWKLVTKNVLPQGAPTSPLLSNVVCQRLDYLLTGLAKRFGLKYSRYADDITFSSMHNVYDVNGEFRIELNRIIKNQNFHVNASKVRLQKSGFSQIVTGLTVNEKVNVPKRYIKQLRMYLYYWERYGYLKANEIFRKDYLSDKNIAIDGLPAMQNVLKGKLDYLKMIKGNSDGTFKKLNARFEILKQTMNPVNVVLDEWEENGIEKALELYTEIN